MGHLLVPDAIVQGGRLTRGLALLIEGATIARVGPVAELERQARRKIDLTGLVLAPGLVDLQVNGGGGALFNDAPTLDGIAAIAKAHAERGTTTLLPTLVTSDEKSMVEAFAASARACALHLPGVAGVHFEGPFLDEERRGAHESRFLRAPRAQDLELLGGDHPGKVLVTLSARHATERVTGALLNAGVLLSLGHTNADADEAWTAFERGVTLVTHLFNAMTGLTGRAPGVVGAALAHPKVTACAIADGLHVDPRSLRVAARAKGPEHFLCVSDAIALAASSATETRLAGQVVRRVDGRCLNEEGNLAGSGIVLAESLLVLVQGVGLSLPEAITACSTVPARVLGLTDRGRIAPGLRADLIALDQDLVVQRVWQGGAELSD